MRGKALPEGQKQWSTRITPAYAGKSRPHPWWRRPEWDHPRVCGEKRTAVFGLPLTLGSPPRMRGKGRVPPSNGGGQRITPAYAGKRPPGSSSGSWKKDHPRVCGEKAGERFSHGKMMGSPPRMRGKACTCCYACPLHRITPACAGKRGAPCRWGSRWRGSPPRMRGKAKALKMLPRHIGITPAYAGKSYLPCVCFWACRDHPRVCGEKTKKIP